MNRVGESLLNGAQEALGEININSPVHLSLLFFGGDLKIDTEEPIRNENGSYEVYKGGERKGEIKYKKNKKIIKIKGLSLTPIREWKTKKEGIYSLNDENLTLISKKENTDAAKLARGILELRKLNKQISTYYKNTLKVTTEEGYVHTNYLTCLIPTCRISSKNPNMQNQPDPNKTGYKVRQHFVSRYKKGVILKFDLSQIEVICFAFLCQDPTLISLLINNKDIHRFIASHIYNLPEEEITKDIRTVTKPVTFTIIYGGGAYKISINTGLDLIFCEAAIKMFYELFPKSKDWHFSITKEVEYTGQLQLFNGRILKFNKYPTTKTWKLNKGITEEYNFSEVKDYPCQALAGDIQFILLGKLWRKSIIHRDKYLLINTVHDDTILDCKEEFIGFAESMIKSVVDKWPEIVYNTWKVKWELPIKFEIQYGKSWYDCK